MIKLYTMIYYLCHYIIYSKKLHLALDYCNGEKNFGASFIENANFGDLEKNNKSL